MKRYVFMFCFFMFIIVSSGAVFAAEAPGLYYDFYYEWDESWDFIPATWSGNSCELEYANNSLHVTMLGKDPNFGLEIREAINLEEYPFVKIKVKNESVTSEKFELYLARDGEPIAEAGVFHHVIGKEHTEFKEFIIDAATAKGSWWKGELTQIRFDCLNNPGDDEESFYIEYIAFFKSQADAEAWTPDRSQTPPPTPSPTMEPTPTKEPTAVPATMTPETPVKSGKDGNLSTTVIVICIIAVLAATVAAVVLIIRARKNS